MKSVAPRAANPLDGWRGKRARLSYAYEVTLGKMLDTAKNPPDGAIPLPYIRAANIQDSGLSLLDLKTMPFSPSESAHLDLRAGDLLVVEGGAVGTAVRLDRDLPGLSFQKTVNRIRARSTASTRMLAYTLRCYRDARYFEALCSGSTFAHLTTEKLAALAIPDPPQQEQEAIADFLDEQTSRLDTLIAKQGGVKWWVHQLMPGVGG
ncbi:MAG: restriction endonuclease subunit S [Kineosporiaceae bacterium]